MTDENKYNSLGDISLKEQPETEQAHTLELPEQFRKELKDLLGSATFLPHDKLQQEMAKFAEKYGLI